MRYNTAQGGDVAQQTSRERPRQRWWIWAAVLLALMATGFGLLMGLVAVIMWSSEGYPMDPLAEAALITHDEVTERLGLAAGDGPDTPATYMAALGLFPHAMYHHETPSLSVTSYVQTEWSAARARVVGLEGPTMMSRTSDIYGASVAIQDTQLELPVEHVWGVGRTAEGRTELMVSVALGVHHGHYVLSGPLPTDAAAIGALIRPDIEAFVTWAQAE